MPKTWKRWTKEEDEFIKDNYRQLTVKELVGCLDGRTERAVRGRIERLGLTLKDLKRGQTYKKYTWSEEEIEKVIKYSTLLSDEEIYNRHLNHLPNSNWVYRKRRELELEGKEPYKHGKHYLHKDGYLHQFVNGKTIWEHREIMENSIGRGLTDEELIHHINGVKGDNRIENLYLCDNRSHHATVHKQLESVAMDLVSMGVIEFDKEEGLYHVNSDILPIRTEDYSKSSQGQRIAGEKI